MITLVFPGEPVPQARPRTTKTGHTYTPAKSRQYKGLLQGQARVQMAGQSLCKAGPLALSVRVYRSAPKGKPQKWQTLAAAGLIRPVTKPDLDNYIKAVQDALTGIVWQDDNQIVTYAAPFGKFYDDGGGPRVEVRVWALDEEFAVWQR